VLVKELICALVAVTVNLSVMYKVVISAGIAMGPAVPPFVTVRGERAIGVPPKLPVSIDFYEKSKCWCQMSL
jgi:hypothetical protein